MIESDTGIIHLVVGHNPINVAYLAMLVIDGNALPQTASNTGIILVEVDMHRPRRNTVFIVCGNLQDDFLNFASIWVNNFPFIARALIELVHCLSLK